MKNRNIENHDNWQTPPDFYDELDLEFDFNFDPCPLNCVDFDGLAIDWKERNFINPPYSRKLKEAFVKKAIEEKNRGKLCVLLLPVSTSTRLFHDEILPNISEPIRFVRGRLRFIGRDQFGQIVNNKTGMHDSMIVIMDGRSKL